MEQHDTAKEVWNLTKENEALKRKLKGELDPDGDTETLICENDGLKRKLRRTREYLAIYFLLRRS